MKNRYSSTAERERESNYSIMETPAIMRSGGRGERGVGLLGARGFTPLRGRQQRHDMRIEFAND